MEARLQGIVRVSKEQSEIKPVRSTMGPILTLRMENTEGQNELHYVFIELEKAYNRVQKKTAFSYVTP